MTTKTFVFLGGLNCFMKYGQFCLHFPTGTTRAEINNYLIKKSNPAAVTFTSQSEFCPTQRTIMIADYTQIANHTYVYVKDGDEFYYYFIDNIEPLPIADDAPAPHPALIHISPDCMLTDFYHTDGENDTYTLPHIFGNLIQSTDVWGNRYGDLPIRPVYNYIEGFDDEIFLNRQRYICVTFATQYTVGAMVLNKAYDNDLIDGIVTAANIIKIKDSKVKPSEQNVNILHIYVLPRDWLFDITSNPNSGDNYFSYETSSGKTGEALKFSLSNLNERVAYYEPDRNKVGAGTKIILQLATKTIDIPYAPTQALDGTPFFDYHLPNINIYINATNYGSDTITILMLLNGEFIDITADFEADFAVNEQRLQMSQDKIGTVLGTVTNAIGAVGGVVGGARSGDYFGAVSSLAAGVQGVTGQIAALRAPAQAQNNGNALTAYWVYVGMRWIYLDADNKDQIQAEIDNHGYIYQGNFVRLTASDFRHDDVFYKLANVYCIGYFDNDTSKEIAERFERGIKFYGIS